MATTTRRNWDSDNDNQIDAAAVEAGAGSPLTTKGDIEAYDTAPTRLPVGADGQVLTANSATGTGLEWAAAGTSGVATEDEGISVDPTATTLNFVGAGVTATDAGSNVTTITIPGGGGASPLTTKGDLYTYDTGDQRLPVGTNGQILSANSATATGLEWIANTGGGGGGGSSAVEMFDAFIDTNGTLITAHTPSPLNTGSLSWTEITVGGDALTPGTTTINASNSVVIGLNNHGAIVDPGTDDVEFSFQFTTITGEVNRVSAITSWVDNQNYIFVNLREEDNDIGIGVSIAGVSTFVRQSFTFEENEEYIVNVRRIGKMLTVTITEVDTPGISATITRTINELSLATNIGFVRNAGSSLTTIDYFAFKTFNTGGGSGGGSGGGYSELLGDGVATSFVVNHNLGTRDVVVEVYRNSGIYDKVYPEILHTDDNNVTIDFTTTTPTTDEFAVFITSGGGGSGGRTTLTANTTYYVATTGNDSNDGLTVGTPFLTLQKAIDTVASIDPREFTVDIQLADGTYDTQLDIELKAHLASSAVIIKGNSGNRNLVVLENTNVTSSGATLDVVSSSPWGVQDLTITNDAASTPGGNYCIRNEFNTLFTADNVRLLAGAGGSTRGVEVASGGVFRVPDGSTGIFFEGSFGSLMFVIGNNSGVVMTSTTLTFTSTPSVSTYVFALQSGHYTQFNSTITGSLTGIRYNLRGCSTIRTATGVDTEVPGSIAGSLSGGSFLIN